MARRVPLVAALLLSAQLPMGGVVSYPLAAWLALCVGQLGLASLDRGTLAVPAAPVRASRAPSLTTLSP